MDTRTAEQLRRDIARLERRLAALESVDRPEADASAYLPLSGGTMTGDIAIDADNMRSLGGSAAGWAHVYASDAQGRNVGDLRNLINQARGGFPNASPPTSPNADDAEFNNTTAAQNNTIGTWAGGDFWEAITASAVASIHSTVANCLYVQARRTDANNGEYKANVAALSTGDKLTIGVQPTLPYSATSADQVALRIKDTVNNLEAVIRIINVAGVQTAEFLTGALGAPTSRATLALYPPYGPVGLQLHLLSGTNVRAFLNPHPLLLSSSSMYLPFGSPNGYAPGAGWAPNLVTLLFVKNADASPAYANYYLLDFFRRST